ncbi:hypothetical protein DAETH_21770 [Deinococcus aetherius]|uniref:Uncharacterized protein n=1 Tax=Deinococcus aetherius TaxID=200252 RepID=A0ABM8AEJ4_9DEIO|nr:hypothetical protein [Deinococcus aetherius]BDP42208.1 hypothetical protein DAETH_21770 [Deinococcus aetherius]
MYLTFSPPDFSPEASEQHLQLWQFEEAEALQAWLESEGWDGVLTDAEPMSRQAFLERAERLLSNLTSAPLLDPTWIETGWKLNDDGDDVTLEGEGQGTWLAIHWFTTA